MSRVADGGMQQEVLLHSEEAVQRFDKFFSIERQRTRIEAIASQYPQVRSLEVDLQELAKHDSDLADAVVEQPDLYRASAEKAIALMEVPTPIEKAFAPHVRFYNVPEVPKYRPMVLELGADHLNKLVSVEGVVSSISEIKPRMKKAIWRCRHCEAIQPPSYTEKTEPVTPPFQCANRNCNRNHFELLEEKSEFIDMQRAQMQDFVEKLRGNVPAVHVELWLEDDLTNKIAPGDKVTLAGALRLKPISASRGGRSSVYAKFLEVMHVHEMELEFEELEITREEEHEILKLSRDPKLFEKITASIAPSIYGYTELKQAIALQLFGGTPGKVLPDGERIRSDAHVLLIGDPGCLIGDERIVLGNGEIAKLQDLGSTHLQEINVRLRTGEGGGRTDVATVFHKYEKQPIIEVITESGKSVKGTYNHPLMCIEGDYGRLKRIWKRLDEMKAGDKLEVITGIRCKISAYRPTGFKPIETKLGPKFNGKLPEKMTPELAAFLGYVLGDGWVRDAETGFVVAEQEKDIIPKLKTYCEMLFGLQARPWKYELPAGRKVPMHYFALYSKDVCTNLQFLKEKRVPSLVMRSGNEVAAEFLKWFFEADGTVFDNGRGKRVIGLKAKNIELLRDVQILLLRFHIHSRIVGNALLIRRGNDILRFAGKIGFVSQKKRTRLENLASHAKHFKRFKSQRTERIVKILRHPPEDVFDVEVPKTHRFIANGIISHNTGKSTMLEYVSHIAPKCIVVSGGSSSGVGLTASAEKDEIGEGWVLKAGAMVLANGGVVAVDELDKMREEDRGAMHQAMEQGYISVAKAGIVTSFQTRTAVLAAANPKLGRFDPNTPPAQQFAISPALLSRFDLIFTMRDVLDESRDRGMAEHILIGHRLASQPPLEKEKESPVTPLVDQMVLRKYIAYSRRHVTPQLSKEAADKIRDYYVELRKIGKEQNTFPVTPRQIEGLVRLSEASAKMRLSPVVELEDAQRALNLFDFVIHEVFVDRETGRLDSDVVNIGVAKSRLDRVRTILNIIGDLEKQFDLVAVEDVVREASSYNIDEYYARNLVEELQRKGDLYAPKPGYVKSARPRE